MNKYKQLWAIEAAGSQTGDTVPVMLKSGKTKSVTLGAEIQPGVFLPVEDAPVVPDTSATGFKEAFGSKAYQERKARGAAVVEAFHAAAGHDFNTRMQEMARD